MATTPTDGGPTWQVELASKARYYTTEEEVPKAETSETGNGERRASARGRDRGEAEPRKRPVGGGLSGRL